jgi:hypothetical protein
MAALAIQDQKIVRGLGNSNFVITRVRHDGTAVGTFSVDQSATYVRVIPLEGQTAPTVTIGSSGDSNFLKEVNVNGLAGLCDVLTYHQGNVASSKV